LARFYESALGFRRVTIEHLSRIRVKDELDVGGRALRITLALGEQRLTLLQFIDQPGNAYPEDATSTHLIFQHFAIVVTDMAAAMAQLQATSGWTPITTDGPQKLPASSGGVTAFKFRDPEGHPLELLAFPPDDIPDYWRDKASAGPFLGIDHSAISISSTTRSIAFYESLGLSVSRRSCNEGPAQARLDHVDEPVVEVTAMATAGTTPHLELLCYCQRNERAALDLRANDVAATCLVFGGADRVAKPDMYLSPPRHLQDPDGHHLSEIDLPID
jgi:catechol 2,3-dioxygenase-like lactoylglutathione lyase family enzyme